MQWQFRRLKGVWGQWWRFFSEIGPKFGSGAEIWKKMAEVPRCFTILCKVQGKALGLCFGKKSDYRFFLFSDLFWGLFAVAGSGIISLIGKFFQCALLCKFFFVIFSQKITNFRDFSRKFGWFLQKFAIFAKSNWTCQRRDFRLLTSVHLGLAIRAKSG